MIDQVKKVLLSELYSRLLYDTKVWYEMKDVHGNVWKLIDVQDRKEARIMIGALSEIVPVENIKLYLRPLKDMTKEEEAELKRLGVDNLGSEGLFSWATEARHGDFWFRIEEWLLSHHFDHRNLIGTGLALEAPEGVYE